MEDYKQDIKNSRKGCLGGSDGSMIMQIANLGFVPKSAFKRLAVVKGFIENEEIPYTAAVRTGDEIEQAIFAHLSQNDNTYQSNPRLESKKYSRDNVKLIIHPDIFRVDTENRTVFIGEVKATKYSVEDTKTRYRGQLFIENLVGKEYARSMGSHWKFSHVLVHYDTSGLDLETGHEFDPSRMTVNKVIFRSAPFDLGMAMDVVSDFLQTFDFYAEDDVVEAQYLPAEVSSKFEAIANILREIKEQEAEVEAFKDKLYAYLVQKDIKSVRCTDFSFTIVEPTQVVSFDHKQYMADLENKHPRVAKRIREQYKKTSQKKGYVKISVTQKQ